MRIRAEMLALGFMAIALTSMTAMGRAKPAHGPFTAKDWSELRSAHASAVSASGTILYSVSYGAAKGPTNTDWWTMGADGNNPKKLEMPETHRREVWEMALPIRSIPRPALPAPT